MHKQACSGLDSAALENFSMCAPLQVTGWFTEKLNYEYDPLVHGNTAEWLSDLVSISFDEPPKYFKRSMRYLKVTPILCLVLRCAYLACREEARVPLQGYLCCLLHNSVLHPSGM